MNAFLLRGKLKYTPSESEGFYIYDLGTYYVAVEENTIAARLLSSFDARYKECSDLMDRSPERAVLINLEKAGLIVLGSGTTEENIIFSMLKKCSFGPGKKTDSDVYRFVETFWKRDGLRQDSFITLSDITSALESPKEDIRCELFDLVNKGSIICYPAKPSYSKEKYKETKTIPFLVYTEKEHSIKVETIFKKEVTHVS